MSCDLPLLRLLGEIDDIDEVVWDPFTYNWFDVI